METRSRIILKANEWHKVDELIGSLVVYGGEIELVTSTEKPAGNMVGIHIDDRHRPVPYDVLDKTQHVWVRKLDERAHCEVVIYPILFNKAGGGGSGGEGGITEAQVKNIISIDVPPMIRGYSYSKEDVSRMLNLKADEDYVDALHEFLDNSKADKADTYTKKEVDDKVANLELPLPPQEDGVYGYDKYGHYAKVIPKNIVDELPNPDLINPDDRARFIIASSDGSKWYQTSYWKIGITHLENTKASMTLSAGGIDGEGDLRIGELWAGLGYGIGVAKNSILNQIEFDNEGIYHTHGMFDKTKTEKILVESDVPTSGMVHEVRLDEKDHRDLLVIMNDGSRHTIDLSKAMSEYLAKGGVRMVHTLEKNEWNNYSFKGRMTEGSEIEVDLVYSDFRKQKAGRCEFIEEDENTSYIRIYDEFTSCKLYFETEGRWKPLGTNVTDGDGLFEPTLVVYTRRAGAPYWTEARSGVKLNISTDANNLSSFNISTPETGVSFTTKNEATDVKFAIRIGKLPQGVHSNDEIRFGIAKDTTSATDKYQTFSLSFEKIPNVPWIDFETNGENKGADE